jgi:hypothetical protein
MLHAVQKIRSSCVERKRTLELTRAQKPQRLHFRTFANSLLLLHLQGSKHMLPALTFPLATGTTIMSRIASRTRRMSFDEYWKVSVATYPDQAEPGLTLAQNFCLLIALFVRCFTTLKSKDGRNLPTALPLWCYGLAYEASKHTRGVRACAYVLPVAIELRQIVCGRGRPTILPTPAQRADLARQQLHTNYRWHFCC